MRRRIVRKIDLDAIPEMQNKTHADHLLILSDQTTIIVEETRNAKTKDVHQLQQTLQYIRKQPIAQLLGIPDLSKIVCLLHYKKCNSMMYRYIIQQQRTFIKRYNTPLITANCINQIRYKLKIDRTQNRTTHEASKA